MFVNHVVQEELIGKIDLQKIDKACEISSTIGHKS